MALNCLGAQTCRIVRVAGNKHIIINFCWPNLTSLRQFYMTLTSFYDVLTSSALTLFEHNMSICEVLLSHPDRLFPVFDAAMAESESQVMSDHPQKHLMVYLRLYWLSLKKKLLCGSFCRCQLSVLLHSGTLFRTQNWPIYFVKIKIKSWNLANVLAKYIF